MSELVNRRRRVLGSGLRQYYDFPFHPIRGEGVWLCDGEGRKYLDVYNNVPHVGHCHPHVVAALRAQASAININTRYLHESVIRYAERIVATMPSPLNACMFTCTGSEANDLALRIARTVTGATGVIVTRRAYHGNTALLNAIDGSSADEREMPDWCAQVPAPEFSSFEESWNAQNYAQTVSDAVRNLAGRSVRTAAFMFDSLFCSDGLFVPPKGFLAPAIAAIRDAGGLCVADEIQAGLGRLGSHMWGFDALGICPDLVTLGKPMGNGHPIGVVVTRREIVEEFFARDRYFNTFAGNPVSAEVGNAVLDVMEREALRENAHAVGGALRQAIEALAAEHSIIGDVRGEGLLLGVELVRDQATREPAGREARFILNDLCRRGVLVGLTGPNRKARNILKIRPPLVFANEHVDVFSAAMDQSLRKMQATDVS